MCFLAPHIPISTYHASNTGEVLLLSFVAVYFICHVHVQEPGYRYVGLNGIRREEGLPFYLLVTHRGQQSGCK